MDPFGVYVGPMLGPCCGHVGPMLGHVGPMLGCVEGFMGLSAWEKYPSTFFFLLRVISGLVSRPGTPANKNMGPRLGPGAAIWIHLGFKLGPCWGHVGPMLRPCWGHVGAMLGHEGGFMG